RVVDNVDLLVVELRRDGANPLAEFTDAGTLGVDARLVRPHRDLGAVASFSGQGDDFDRAAGDLRNLQGEELANERRMRAGDGDLRPLDALADPGDVDADA